MALAGEASAEFLKEIDDLLKPQENGELVSTENTVLEESTATQMPASSTPDIR